MALCAALGGCETVNTRTCTAADKANIEARYSENVAIKCAAYGSLAECPYYTELKADRANAEKPCR